MQIEDVAKLPPLERFTYWIRERYELGIRRKAGQPTPWTDDEVLQRVFFTWPYREMDKTTVWFRENVRDPLRDSLDVLMATVIFRWFNKIETGILLRDYDNDESYGLLSNWRKVGAVRYLKQVKGPVFTGAFMIPAVPGTNKVDHVCDQIQNVWESRNELLDAVVGGTLENAHSNLIQYPWLGGFMAYEIVCDLRYTYLLERARDRLIWCNPGPGCARGLLRLRGQSLKGIPAAHGCRPPDGWLSQIRELREVVSRRLDGMPRFEMREIEHSLCEWDKYERALWGDGRVKRKYNGYSN